jgi:hypothetical protein
MKPIRDEFNLLPVLWQLEFFHEYLNDVEKFIEDKAIEFDKRYAKIEQEIKQKLDEEDEDWDWPGGWSKEAAEIAALDSYLEDDYNKVKKVFPNLLRRSFFVYVYSVLEGTLNNCCRLLNYQGRPLEDVKSKGESIKRARKYLEDAVDPAT